MGDIPGEMTPAIVCPACGSKHIEALSTAESGTLEYRCLDCEIEFAVGGDEPPAADSDDPDAPYEPRQTNP